MHFDHQRGFNTGGRRFHINSNITALIAGSFVNLFMCKVSIYNFFTTVSYFVICLHKIFIRNGITQMGKGDFVQEKGREGLFTLLKFAGLIPRSLKFSAWIILLRMLPWRRGAGEGGGGVSVVNVFYVPRCRHYFYSPTETFFRQKCNCRHQVIIIRVLYLYRIVK